MEKRTVEERGVKKDKVIHEGEISGNGSGGGGDGGL